MIPSNDPLNGQPCDKIIILFVNERPGPTSLKTNVISFENPDGSARRFKRLFEKVFGLKFRKKIFITNSVLWCPKMKNYKNITPRNTEIKNSSKILLGQINKIKPSVIVTMGRTALTAVTHCFENNIILSHSKQLRLEKIAGSCISKTPYKIIPLFHTSQLNIKNRSEKQQLKDWLKMAKNL